MKAEGLTMRSSHFGPKETMDRLEAAVASHGMVVTARIDYASSAASLGVGLRPAESLIFRNLWAEAALVQAARTIAIDLPLRALVWQDDEGHTCLTYVQPQWLANRHGLFDTADDAVQRLTREIAEVVREATKGPANGIAIRA